MTGQIISWSLVALLLGATLGFILASILMTGKLADAKADTERLDMIEQRQISVSTIDGKWALVTGSPARVLTGNAYPSLRSAVDNCMLAAAAGKD